MAATSHAWRAFLDCLRSGDSRDTAFDMAGIDSRQFEATLREGGSRVLEYEEALTEGLRARWGVAEVETIIDDLVAGRHDGSLERIVKARKRKYPEFLRLVERDPLVAQKYAEGRRMQAEAMADEIVMIAGDKEAKPKVDALKWLMTKMSEKFNDARKEASKAQDSAELDMMLEEGRRRVEELFERRKDDG